MSIGPLIALRSLLSQSMEKLQDPPSRLRRVTQLLFKLTTLCSQKTFPSTGMGSDRFGLIFYPKVFYQNISLNKIYI